MANDLTDALLKRLSDIGVRIQQKMADAGENASGRTSASIHAEKYDKGVKLVAGKYGDVAPLFTLEVGRKNGRFPPVSRIFQWSIDKGIQFADDAERRSFAYAVRGSIAKRGTLRHQNNRVIYSDEVQAAKAGIVKDIKNSVVDTVKSYLSKIN